MNLVSGIIAQAQADKNKLNAAKKGASDLAKMLRPKTIDQFTLPTKTAGQERASLEERIRYREARGQDSGDLRKQLFEQYAKADPTYQTRMNQASPTPVVAGGGVTTIQDAMKLLDRSSIGRKRKEYAANRDAIKKEVADQLRRNQSLDAGTVVTMAKNRLMAAQGLQGPPSPAPQTMKQAVDQSWSEAFPPAKVINDAGGMGQVLSQLNSAMGMFSVNPTAGAVPNTLAKRGGKAYEQGMAASDITPAVQAADALGKMMPTPDPTKALTDLLSTPQGRMAAEIGTTMMPFGFMAVEQGKATPANVGAAIGGLAKGAMDVVNPGTYLSAPADTMQLVNAATAIAKAPEKDRQKMARDLLNQMTGPTDADKIKFATSLLGGVAGGAAALKSLKAVAVKPRKGAPVATAPEAPAAQAPTETRFTPQSDPNYVAGETPDLLGMARRGQPEPTVAPVAAEAPTPTPAVKPKSRKGAKKKAEPVVAPAPAPVVAPTQVDNVLADLEPPIVTQGANAEGVVPVTAKAPETASSYFEEVTKRLYERSANKNPVIFSTRARAIALNESNVKVRGDGAGILVKEGDKWVNLTDEQSAAIESNLGVQRNDSVVRDIEAIIKRNADSQVSKRNKAASERDQKALSDQKKIADELESILASGIDPNTNKPLTAKKIALIRESISRLREPDPFDAKAPEAPKIDAPAPTEKKVPPTVMPEMTPARQAQIEKVRARKAELEAKRAKQGGMNQNRERGAANIGPDDIELLMLNIVDAVYTNGEHAIAALKRLGDEMGLTRSQRDMVHRQLDESEYDIPGTHYFKPDPKDVPGELQFINPDDIKVHPNMQMRGLAKGSKQVIVDPKSNTTSAYKDVNVYDHDKAGELLVWERKNGEMFVIDGHHRLDIAKRASGFIDKDTGRRTVPASKGVKARIAREADGVTLEMARGEGALRNLASGNGDPLDFVVAMDDLGFSLDDLRAQGFAFNGVVAKQVRQIMELPRSVRDKIKAGEINLSAQQAAAISDAAKGANVDDVMNIALIVSEESRLETFGQVRSFASEYLKSARVKAIQSTQDDFGSLLGMDDEFTRSITNMKERALIKESVKRMFQNERRNIGSLVNAFERPNEFIDKTGRAKDRDALGSTVQELNDKVDTILQDPDLEKSLNELASRVMTDPDYDITDAANELSKRIQKYVTQFSSSELSKRKIKGEKLPELPSDPANAGPPRDGGVAPQQQARAKDPENVKFLEVDGTTHRVELTPEQAKQWKEAEREYDRAVSWIDPKGSIGYSKSKADSMRRTAAFELAKKKREIVGIPTAKEAAKEAVTYKRGDRVETEFGMGTIDGPPTYGKYKVKLDSGGETRLTREGIKKISKPRKGRESGQTDIRTVATTAGVAGAALATPLLYKWASENGLDREFAMVAGMAGAAAFGAALTRVGKVKIGTDIGFDVMKSILSPKDLVKVTPDNMGKIVMQRVLNANAVRTFYTAKGVQDVTTAAKEVFGNKFLNNPVFREWNYKVRDVMEENVAAGKAWHTGLPAEVKQFVEQVKPVLDDLINRWEKTGGRVEVTNDGVQHTKMDLGAVVKLNDDAGTYGVYVGLEPNRQGAPNILVQKVVNRPGDPFLAGKHPDLEPIDADIVKIKPGDSFGRPIWRMGESFVPRMYTGEFVEQLRKNDPDFNAAFAAMLEENNKHLGLSGDQLLAEVKDIVDAFSESGNSSIANFLANLEKPRVYQMSKFTLPDGTVVDPYENSYIEAITRYIDRGNVRVSIAEQFGINPKGIGDAITSVGSSGAPGADKVAAYLNSLVARTFGIGPDIAVKSRLKNAGTLEAIYQSATKLTGGTSLISQFNDIIFPLTDAPSGSVARGIYKLVTDRSFAQDMQVLGAVHENWLRDIKLTKDDVAISNLSAVQKLRKGAKMVATQGSRVDGTQLMADAVMTMVGYRAADRIAKMTSMAAMYQAAEDLLVKAAKGKASPADIRMMERMGIGKEASKVKGLSRADIAKVFKNERFLAKLSDGIRGRYQYTGATEDVPLWMSHPVGAMAWRFKKPWYIGTKNIVESVLSEAGQGNFKPMAKFVGYGLVVGSAAGYVKSLVRMEGTDARFKKLVGEGRLEEAMQHFFERTGERNFAVRIARSKPLMDILSSAAETIHQSGGLGVLGELNPAFNQNVRSSTPGKEGWEPMNAVTPLALQSMMRAGDAARNLAVLADWMGVNAGKRGWQKDQDKMGAQADLYETIRSEAIPVRRMLDLLGVKPELVELRELERREKALLGRLPERDRPLKSGMVLTAAEYARMKVLDMKLRGRFEMIQQEFEKAKGDSLKATVNKAIAP